MDMERDCGDVIWPDLGQMHFQCWTSWKVKCVWATCSGIYYPFMWKRKKFLSHIWTIFSLVDTF